MIWTFGCFKRNKLIISTCFLLLRLSCTARFISLTPGNAISSISNELLLLQFFFFENASSERKRRSHRHRDVGHDSCFFSRCFAFVVFLGSLLCVSFLCSSRPRPSEQHIAFFFCFFYCTRALIRLNRHDSRFHFKSERYSAECKMVGNILLPTHTHTHRFVVRKENNDNGTFVRPSLVLAALNGEALNQMKNNKK